MTRFFIKRVASLADAMFGVFLQDAEPFAVTGELPWLNNQQKISCIPAATYRCVRGVHQLHSGPIETFEITAVSGRSGCLFHKANVPRLDLEGCVGVAEKFGLLNGSDAILESGEGFAEFIRRTAGMSEFQLTILDCTNV